MDKHPGEGDALPGPVRVPQRLCRWLPCSLCLRCPPSAPRSSPAPPPPTPWCIFRAQGTQAQGAPFQDACYIAGTAVEAQARMLRSTLNAVRSHLGILSWRETGWGLWLEGPGLLCAGVRRTEERPAQCPGHAGCPGGLTRTEAWGPL